MKSSLITPFALIILLSVGACNRNEVSREGVVQTNSNPTTSGKTGQDAEKGGTEVAFHPKTDACALLTSTEIEAVQNEPVRTTKLSGSAGRGFSVAQCFFTLPTFSNSISLQITQKGEGSAASDPREFWRETFHSERSEKSELERAQERARDQIARKEEDGEKVAPPKKIDGIGDEAFWMANHVGGALYVLKGNNYLRISVGGAGDQNSKLKKSSTLAQKAIARLNS